MQGWITERAVKIGDVDVWSEELKYYEPTAQEAQPRFDGMISETKSELHLSGHSNSIYQYDKLKRIISTKSRNSSLGNFNNRESGITYDRNGNILTLERDGNYSYQYSYDGNRMICLYEEGACYEDNYIWNEAGALTERSGDLSGTTIVFVYNVAGFPRSINGKDYVYLSDGTKVKMLGADGKGLLYRGNFVYHTHPPQYGHPLLESIGHREGRFVVTGKTGDDTPDLQDLYFVRDHLGSVVSILERGDDSSFDISDIREENLYHSYGTLHRGNGIPGMSSNRYRYNGKEEQPVGTDYIDYGARLYSPGLGRWLSPDPLAEKYYNVSPYAFCNNNPVNFVDPDGEDVWEINSNGIITWVEESDEHRLYYIDSEGNRGDNYITVNNRKILDAFTGKDGMASYTDDSNIDDFFKVFLFAADNSDVEWALHRGRDNSYTIGTSHRTQGVDSYSVLTGTDEIPIASIHSHPNVITYKGEIESMGYDAGWVKYGNDRQKVYWGVVPVYNYVYFPISKTLYNVEYSSPRYIKRINGIYKELYFGTLNYK